MSNLDSQGQEWLKLMMWQESRKNPMAASAADSSNLYSKLLVSGASTPTPPPPTSHTLTEANPKKVQIFPGGFDEDDELVAAVVPAVTVVLEGRSICQRISLDKHASYGSLAKALKQMFVDGDGDGGGVTSSSDGGELDLANAIPGHLIAYEDMENDLLLVGDLKWNDFVRVAKRIRILPVKPKSRKGRVEN